MFIGDLVENLRDSTVAFVGYWALQVQAHIENADSVLAFCEFHGIRNFLHDIRRPVGVVVGEWSVLIRQNSYVE
jgi:hypothetical protein